MIKNLIPNEKISFIFLELNEKIDGRINLNRPLNSIIELKIKTKTGMNDMVNAIFLRDGEVYRVNSHMTISDITFPITGNELLKATFWSDATIVLMVLNII